MSRLNDRFGRNDFVDSNNSKIQNPYEEMGLKFEKAQSIAISHPLAFPNKTLYGMNLGTDNPQKLTFIKKVSSDLATQAGLPFREQVVDHTQILLSKYRLTSEGVTQFFDDAKNAKGISVLQYEVIKMELQAISTARTHKRILNILSTVEEEVFFSRISQTEKNQLLMLNAMLRHNDVSSELSSTSQPSINLDGSQARFQQVAIPVGWIILIVMATYIVAAFLSPICNQSCQNAAIAGAALAGIFGLIICQEDSSSNADTCFEGNNNQDPIP